MNLLARYNMLRQATLQLVGLPTDNIEELKKLSAVLAIPAMTDPDAATSRLVLQTLIVTHGGTDTGLCVDEGCPHHGVPHICIPKESDDDKRN